MSQVTRTSSKTKFNTGDTPTENDFVDLHDSIMWNDESHNGINTQSGTSYTLVLTDANKIVEMNNASANTLTVPPNSSVAFGLKSIIKVVQLGAGVTTIQAGSGVTINSNGGIMTLAGQYKSVTLYKRGTNEWVMEGAASVGGGGTTQLSTPTLTMTAASDTAMDFSWTNVSNEDGYTVEIHSNSGYTALVDSESKGADVTTHQFDSLTPSTTYYGRVKAEGSGSYTDSNWGTDNEPTNAGGGGGYDADAAAGFNYITGTLGDEITSGEETAVNALIVAIKAINSGAVWTKIKGLYPHVGNTTDAMGVNFKNLSKNLTLNGTVATHAKGLRYTGSSGWAEAPLQISNTIGDNDFGTYNIGATYSLEEALQNCYVGAEGTTDFSLFQSDGVNLIAYPRVGNSSSGVAYAGAIPTGTQTLQRKSDGSVGQLYWNGTFVGEDTNAVNSFVADGNVTLNSYAGTINPGIGGFTTAHITILHASVTDAEQESLQAAIATFKTSLSR